MCQGSCKILERTVIRFKKQNFQICAPQADTQTFPAHTAPKVPKSQKYLDFCRASGIIIWLASASISLLSSENEGHLSKRRCKSMAKISANYEVVYIIDPAQSEEAIAATVAKFQTLAEQNGSDVVVDEWGKRRLAYAIDYKTEGYYVLMSFTSGPEFPKELDRILGITEGIMRSMIVCKGE